MPSIICSVARDRNFAPMPLREKSVRAKPDKIILHHAREKYIVDLVNKYALEVMKSKGDQLGAYMNRKRKSIGKIMDSAELDQKEN